MEEEVLNWLNTVFVGRDELKEKLAIIGTGIAGMGAAHFLQDKYELTFFEKNNYIGGHSNTVDVNENGTNIPIDTGFIVYNEVTYPNLTKLFRTLNVPVKNSNMSFSVQHKPTGLEFCGSGIDGLFAQRKNFFNFRYYRLLYNINRFNTHAPSILNQDENRNLSLREFVTKFKYHPDLLEFYLIPMSSAVWSTPINKMLDFPAFTLIRFFSNHGFLGLSSQHQWKTVVGGSRSYVTIITKPFREKILLNSPVQKVTRDSNQVKVTAGGREFVFDKVVFACHADQVLECFENPSQEEKDLLSKFKYELNIATLHTDESVMPKIKKAWSSWNYRVERNSDGTWRDSNLIYWMNSLQGVSKNKDYFISINDPGLIEESKVIRKINYDHPLFTVDSMKAQEKLPSLNGKSNVFFCGSYFRYGFHEDALLSAVNLSELLLGKSPWN